jgi:long-chain-fatty-acid--CoA ligase ACSBG
LANQLVFSKVKESLGLEQCKAMASAAAPLGKHTQEYFSSLDIREGFDSFEQ